MTAVPEGYGPLVEPIGDWTADALCAQTDPDVFYPEMGGSAREAKKVCQACPVVAECLAYALENVERYGVWGNTSERERRAILSGKVGSAVCGHCGQRFALTYSSNRVPTYCSRTCAGKQRAINDGRVAS